MTSASRQLMRIMVPMVQAYLEKKYDNISSRLRDVGVALREWKRMSAYVDTFQMAHLALMVTFDSLGNGRSLKTKINTLQFLTAKYIEDQAFLAYMAETDPFYFKYLQKLYLHDPVRRYDKKVGAMKHAHNKHEGMNFKWMSNQELASFGGLMVNAVMTPFVEGAGPFFEVKKMFHGKGKLVDYLGFSKEGIKYRDLLQAVIDENIFDPQPMLCPPLSWTEQSRGGYLLPPPRPHNKMIHGFDKKTRPSQGAVDALNRLQAVPYRVNKFIWQIQKQLIAKTNKIGAFRSFEADSWKDEFFPIVDSEYMDSLEEGSPELIQMKRKITAAYKQQRLDEKQGATPRRIHTIVEPLLDDEFYMPWFFDSRLRMYPTGSVGITGADFVKALLIHADGMPITDTSREELLIAIATSGDFKFGDGSKVSKATYDKRLEWAEEFVASNEFLAVVLNTLSNSYWREADEPFQFLAYCEEYYSVFVKGYRDRVHVFIGRDMTCSGIQILSSVIGDEKGMEYTNVIPTEGVADAYAEVARVARELIQDPEWLKAAMEDREKKRLAWNKKNPDELREKRDVVNIKLEDIDRTVVKTQVMITGYGGTYMRKREGILDKIKEKEIVIHPGDKGILVKACIEGMSIAFPRYTELNAWFKQVVSAAISNGAEDIQWTSPNGSVVVQDYREPITKEVATYAASGGHYASLLRDKGAHRITQVLVGHGDIRPTKHQSAVAANFTHTLDACMIQEGLNIVDEDIPVVSVHDCLYTMPGYLGTAVPAFRRAFHNVVSSPVLENFIEQNGLEGILEVLEKEEVDLTCCLDAPYMFT